MSNIGRLRDTIRTLKYGDEDRMWKYLTNTQRRPLVSQGGMKGRTSRELEYSSIWGGH